MYCTVRTVPLFLVSHLSTRQSEGTSRPRPPLPNKWSPNKVIRPYMQKMDAIRDKIILYRETFNFCVRKNTKSWAILATKFSHRVHVVKGEKYSTNIPHQIAWNFLCHSLQTRRRDYHDYQVSRVHKHFLPSFHHPAANQSKRDAVYVKPILWPLACQMPDDEGYSDPISAAESPSPIWQSWERVGRASDA